MATKLVDVTLTAITNKGGRSVSPLGALLCQIVRAVDDEQIFDSKALFSRAQGEPVHTSGADKIIPGQSLAYNVTQRLTVQHFEEETEGQLNQTLMFGGNLIERRREFSEVVEEPYFGQFHLKVPFDDMQGFMPVSTVYSAAAGTKIIEVEYSVRLISSS